MKNHIRNENGMTLLELLLSMAILLIIFTVFFQFFSQTALFTMKNEEKIKAINIARETISEIKELSDKDAIIEKKLNEQYIFQQTIQCAEMYTKNDQEYNINICFEDGDKDLPKQLVKVTVSVQHQVDRLAQTETFTYVNRDESDG